MPALREQVLATIGIEPVPQRRAWRTGPLEPVTVETFGKDRRCIYASDGCITILAQANPGPACYCHTARYEQEIEEATDRAPIAA